MIQQHSPLYCFLLQRPSSFLYHLSFIIFPAHCGALQFLTLTSFLCFLHNSLLALHSASMFHNNRQAVLFSILSSLSPSHPVTLGLPCLFLGSCPPPSPLPAATWHHHPPLLPSAPRLPTDSPTETNCRETLSLCEILGKHLPGIKSNKTFSFWNYARESSHVIKFPVFIEW